MSRNLLKNHRVETRRSPRLKTLFAHKAKTLIAFMIVCMSRVYSGQYSAEFLEIGVGARALALGGAFVAAADDGTAFYWNPAGLALINGTRISGMYGPQFGTLSNPMGRYHYLGAAHRLSGKATVAVNWIRLTVDDIPIYSKLKGDSYWDRFYRPELRPTGETEGHLNDYEDAVFFTFANSIPILWDLGWMFYPVHLKWLWGINIKWIRQSIGPHEASGLGFDAGGILQIPFNEFIGDERLGTLAVGIHVRDMSRTRIEWNTPSRHLDETAPDVRWGISYRQSVQRGAGSCTLTYDQNHRWGTTHHWGFEYHGFKRLFLRTGLNDRKFTAGAGLELGIFEIDYAYCDHELSALHRLSASVGL
jgi:hypothetical protein